MNVLNQDALKSIKEILFVIMIAIINYASMISKIVLLMRKVVRVL